MSAGELSMIACIRSSTSRRSASARRRSVRSTSWYEEVERLLAVAVHERDVHERVDDAPVGVHVALLERERAPAAG